MNEGIESKMNNRGYTKEIKWENNLENRSEMSYEIEVEVLNEIFLKIWQSRLKTGNGEMINNNGNRS